MTTMTKLSQTQIEWVLYLKILHPRILFKAIKKVYNQVYLERRH